VINNKGRARVG